jgi:hypothetical protein
MQEPCQPGIKRMLTNLLNNVSIGYTQWGTSIAGMEARVLDWGTKHPSSMGHVV